LRGNSIRIVSDSEFVAIVLAGLRDVLGSASVDHRGFEDADDVADYNLLEAPIEAQERQIMEILLNKKIRDATFRDLVIDAYDRRCAMTGIAIINGHGRAEVQAAHIWAVEDGGPDVVRNGIALSGTVHWMFERGLISISEDYGMLISHNKVPPEWRQMFGHRERQLHLPRNRRDWPHPEYIRKHREMRYGG